MSNPSIHRNWQIDSLEKSLIIVEQLVSSIVDSSVFDKRDGEDGWTISEVIGHLVEAEIAFLNRAKATIQQDNPKLPYANPDQTVIDKDYAKQDPTELLGLWKVNREPFLAYLRSLPDEDATWERPAQHHRGGNFTLTDQLMLAAWHDTNHLYQIVKIING